VLIGKGRGGLAKTLGRVLGFGHHAPKCCAPRLGDAVAGDAARAGAFDPVLEHHRLGHGATGHGDAGGVAAGVAVAHDHRLVHTIGHGKHRPAFAQSAQHPLRLAGQGGGIGGVCVGRGHGVVVLSLGWPGSPRAPGPALAETAQRAVDKRIVPHGFHPADAAQDGRGMVPRLPCQRPDRHAVDRMRQVIGGGLGQPVRHAADPCKGNGVRAGTGIAE